MPELVTCPSCGCRVQIAETRLGLRTRCIACDSNFVASPGNVVPPDPLDQYPLVPDEETLTPPRPPHSLRGLPRHRMPLCPGCHHPVAWDAADCPTCGHLFDPVDLNSFGRRRDGEPHRGEMIDKLGGVSLAFGCLSIGLGPAGLLVAWATGWPALLMSGTDLRLMTTGEVDPAGRPLTEWGRGKAIVGVVLSAVLTTFWTLLMLTLFW